MHIPFSTTNDTNYRDIVAAVLLEHVFGERLTCVQGAWWPTDVDPQDAGLETLARADYDANDRVDTLVRVLDGVAWLSQGRRGMNVLCAATSAAGAAAVEAELRRLLPAADPDASETQVEAKFWWQHNGMPQSMLRTVSAPDPALLQLNYPASTADALAGLRAFTPRTSSGRLILFHGPPGTGKTHAVMGLAVAWRAWADLQIITDPEAFLGSPAYLLDVLTRGRRSAKTSGRWQLVVIEDSGEFLTPSAKSDNGQALSRLLNLTDGALGQATKSLILVTTNEEIHHLHDAVSRSGRCLAEVGFPLLTAAEASRWCEHNSVSEPVPRSMSLADLYALQDEHRLTPASTADRRFGFAA